MKPLLFIVLAIVTGGMLFARGVRLTRPTPQGVVVSQGKPKVGLTDMEIIARSKHPEELLHIYTLESSQGKQDGCKLQGKFNGYGYRQNSQEHMCYDSFQEVTDLVDQWLTNRDLSSYCLYNQGINHPDCPYARHMADL